MSLVDVYASLLVSLQSDFFGRQAYLELAIPMGPVARGYLAARGYLVRDIRGGPCTRISRTPRISRTFFATRYPRGTLHADIS